MQHCISLQTNILWSALHQLISVVPTEKKEKNINILIFINTSESKKVQNIWSVLSTTTMEYPNHNKEINQRKKVFC